MWAARREGRLLAGWLIVSSVSSVVVTKSDETEREPGCGEIVTEVLNRSTSSNLMKRLATSQA